MGWFFGKKERNGSVVEENNTKSRFSTEANPNIRSAILTPFSRPRHRKVIGEAFGKPNEQFLNHNKATTIFKASNAIEV
jgi:hypothetical protein